MKTRIQKLSCALFLLLFTSVVVAQEAGQKLFKQNCGACHTVTKQKTVGPGLEGINERRSEEWLIKWTKDSQAFIKSGDADAAKVFEENGNIVMPPQQLSDDQIREIFAYVKSPAVDQPASDVAATPGVAVKKTAPLSTWVLLFMVGMVLITATLFIYLWALKRDLRSKGIISFDTVPLKDRISKWVDHNGSLVVFVVVCVVVVFFSALVKEWS